MADIVRAADQGWARLQGLLGPADVELLRAEQRGGDFGMFVELHVAPEVFGVCRQALAQTLEAWPSLQARIVADDGGFVAVHDPVREVTELEHAASLRGFTILAARGQRLLHYHLDPERCVLELLGHHVALDADSLRELVQDLDRALVAAPLPHQPEWPWESRHGHVVLPEVPSLASARYPQPGEHTQLPLDRDRVERVDALAHRCGTTPFAVFWAAGARLGSALKEPSDAGPSLGAVVSDRTVRGLGRSGNATRHLSVALAAVVDTETEVRARYEEFVRTWGGRAEPSTGDPQELLISMSGLPDTDGLTAITGVDLGPYVVKFARHVQLQAHDGQIRLECYDQRGGARLLERYLEHLDALLDRRALEAPAPVVPAPVPCREGGTTRQDTDGPLDRILHAAPGTDLRDLRISSFDVLTVLDALADEHGIRVGVEDFYRWEVAADVQQLVQRPQAPADDQLTAHPSAAPPHASAAVTLPHLNDIFIDAYRRGDDDPYEVEFAYRLDVTSRDLHTTTAVVQRVVDHHQMLSARISFGRGGVMFLPGAPLRVRSVRARGWEDVRDRRPLRLRAAGQHLADLAVAEVNRRTWLYLKLHHLLIDDAGLQLLLADVARGLRGEELSGRSDWNALAAGLDRGAQAARRVWDAAPIDTAEFPPAGRTPTAGGQFHQSVLDLSGGTLGLELPGVLGPITQALSDFTGRDRGTFGSVHHGRTIPGSAHAVGSFARVLPIQYDRHDGAVLERSIRRVLQGQAATAGDTGWPNGTAFPIAFQILRVRPLSTGHAERVEFGGRTKFGILLTIVDGGDDQVLEVTVAADVYTPPELRELTAALCAHLPGCRPTVRAA